MLGMGQEWHHMACPAGLQAQLLRQLEKHLLWALLLLQGGPRAGGSWPRCLRVAMLGWPTALRYCLHSCCVNPHSYSISSHSCFISPHSCCFSPHSCCISPHSCCASPPDQAQQRCLSHGTTQLNYTDWVVCLVLS